MVAAVAQRIADLEAEVAQLRGQVRVIGMVSVALEAAFLAGRQPVPGPDSARYAAVAEASRPRHLHLVRTAL